MADEPRDRNASSPPPREQSPWALAGLGMQFFVALFVFVYAGNWMDARFGTSPVLLLVGLVVGGGGSFYLSYSRLMRAMNTETKAKDAPSASRSARKPEP